MFSSRTTATFSSITAAITVVISDRTFSTRIMQVNPTLNIHRSDQTRDDYLRMLTQSANNVFV